MDGWAGVYSPELHHADDRTRRLRCDGPNAKAFQLDGLWCCVVMSSPWWLVVLLLAAAATVALTVRDIVHGQPPRN
jgi:hypothetical protein